MHRARTTLTPSRSECCWPSVQAPRPDGTGPHRPDHWLVPTGRSWQSIASGYVGLVSLAIFFLGPAAIVLGFLGLRAADRQGTHGRGRSIFGIVTGCIGTLLGLLVLFG